MDRFICEFRCKSLGLLGDWETPEAVIPSTWEEALACIAEHADPEANGRIGGSPTDVVRVTMLCADTGKFSDVTEDALIEFAQHRLAETDEWPWWLEDYAPEHVRAA